MNIWIKTSSAGSATLGDKSFDRLMIQLGPSDTHKNYLWLHLAKRNLSDSQFCWASKTEPKVAKGGAPHRKQYTGRGDTAHTLLIGVGTPHNINRKNASHYMAIVGEPCNVEAHANIPALFITMLCPRLCAHMCCTPDCDYTVVSLTDLSIASIQGTPHTHDTRD